MFYRCRQLQLLDVSHLDFSNVTDMHKMFEDCNGVLTLICGDFKNATNIFQMFYCCRKVVSLDLSSLDITKILPTSNGIPGVFAGCVSLNYIKCKQNFKDYCISNPSTVSLPDSMRVGGSGVWDIVD